MKDLDDDNGVNISFCTDGSLFNLKQVQAHTETSERLIREPLFIKDTILVAHTKIALQKITFYFGQVAQHLELEISLKRSSISLHAHEEYRPPISYIDQTVLKSSPPVQLPGMCDLLKC